MRRILVTMAALALAACANDPSANYGGGIGDPVRGAALHAPDTMGDTGRWTGQPADAAAAAVQVEFLADAFRSDPLYAPQINPAATHALDAARAEMRAFLGIPNDAPPTQVIFGLRRAATALRDGSRAQAEAALSGPAFPQGPAAMLTRLSTMPRLPRTAEAGSAAAAEIARLDQQGRSGRR